MIGRPKSTTMAEIRKATVADLLLMNDANRAAILWLRGRLEIVTISPDIVSVPSPRHNFRVNTVRRAKRVIGKSLATREDLFRKKHHVERTRG